LGQKIIRDALSLYHYRAESTEKNNTGKKDIEAPKNDRAGLAHPGVSSLPHFSLMEDGGRLGIFFSPPFFAFEKWGSRRG
jgi:hypothetical protein